MVEKASQDIQELIISTTDRAILETYGVRFTAQGVIFPRGTACSSGMTSATPSTGRRNTLWRYHLPAPSLIEVSFSCTMQDGQEIEREIHIPLKGVFYFAQVRNTDPAFLLECLNYSYSSMSGTWANEYGDHPADPQVTIAGEVG